MMTKAQQAGIKVTDEGLKDYYNKNKESLTELKASHILIKEKDEAQSVLKQLKGGADFAKLAKNILLIQAQKKKAANWVGSNNQQWFLNSVKLQ
ncbi:hypothetical protein NBRC111894_2920 [Sporolactobacillus inulinus]|uniref:peptidylprolyl isomerase n=1 Tax=Sporolactobacillus inulinus TaxID=2078 RepID=A0A4Y1ZE03_9BACL|nr:peptidyl-prolyl cis-trans isomerase [Sporolactobacillus inulinus]GAY77366.1 hypothetical protein NBRC111894_2920 [Sporolactobacillus inulinus]